MRGEISKYLLLRFNIGLLIITIFSIYVHISNQIKSDIIINVIDNLSRHLIFRMLFLKLSNPLFFLKSFNLLW